MSAESTQGSTPLGDVIGKMIVQQMLEIFNLGLPTLNDKSLDWVNNLKCLTVNPGQEHAFQLKIIPRSNNVFRERGSTSQSLTLGSP